MSTATASPGLGALSRRPSVASITRILHGAVARTPKRVTIGKIDADRARHSDPLRPDGHVGYQHAADACCFK